MLFSCFVYADDENEDGAFSIKSTTDLLSAKCVRENGDEKKDKERTEIGIGEVVNLTVEGKMVDDDAEIEWSLEGEGGTLEGEGTTATFTADILNQNKTVTIKAEIKDKNLKTSKEFQIKTPSGLTGKEDSVRDISLGTPGAGGTIKVTVLPDTVSFSELSFLELDKKSPVIVTKPETPWDFPRHFPNTEATEIDEKNNVKKVDDVYSIRQDFNLQLLQGTVAWNWECSYEVGGQKYESLDEDQKFEYYKKDFEADSEVFVKISKFGVVFQRMTFWN